MNSAARSRQPLNIIDIYIERESYIPGILQLHKTFRDNLLLIYTVIYRPAGQRALPTQAGTGPRLQGLA